MDFLSSLHHHTILLLLLLLTACRADSGTWERIQQDCRLRVGLDPTYPPFEIGDENGLRGLDVDLAEAIAQEMGVEAEFVWIGYDGLYDSLRTGQVDVLLSALVIMPSQMDDFSYSTPYFDAGERLIVRGDSGIAGLDGVKTLAVELGAQGHVEALALQKQSPALLVQPYSTADEALAAVLDRRADGGIVDGINGRLFLQTHPALRILPDPITVEPFAAVVRRGDQVLLRELSGAMEVLGENGRLDQILADWLDESR